VIVSITRFAALLRRAGVDVGIDATIAAAEALTLTALDDRSRVQAVLRVVMIRHRRDDETFDEVFESWFGGAWVAGRSTDDDPVEQTASAPAADARLMLDTDRRLHDAAYVDDPSERIGATTPHSETSEGSAAAVLGEEGDDVAPVIDADSDMGAWADAGRADPARAGRPRGLVLLPETLDLLDVMRVRLAATLVERDAMFEAAVRMSTHFAPSDARLLNPFSLDESRRLAQIVRLLRRQLDGAPAWRKRPDHRGVVDLRRTIRCAVVTGGVPIQTVRRTPALRRCRVVLLVDTSLSMRPTTRLMLHVANMLVAQAARVRVVAFVDQCIEVTDTIRHADVASAIGRLIDDPGGGPLDPSRPSDYGAALRSFWTRYGSLVDASTTVIVIGDGRSNGLDPNVEAVSQLRDRSRRLVWLTPEPEGAWGFGHGEMEQYATVCDHAARVRSLDDLAEFVESGVLRQERRHDQREVGRSVFHVNLPGATQQSSK